VGKERLHWRPLTNPSLPRPTNLTVGFFFLRINWFRFGAVSLEGWCAHRLRYAAGLGEAVGAFWRAGAYRTSTHGAQKSVSLAIAEGGGKPDYLSKNKDLEGILLLTPS
jgi:hypothetical protein